MDGKLLEDGDLYHVKEKKISGIVSFTQNNPKMNYMLIALVDYVQQPMLINGNIYENYLFSLTGSASEEINVEINLQENGGTDAIFMIIEQPEYIDLTQENILPSRHFYVCRLRLTDKVRDVDYNRDFTEMNYHSDDLFELSKTHKEIKIMPNCKGGEDVELILGSGNSDTDYALIAFAGWKQVPLWDENVVQYVKVPVGKNVYYNFPVPNVDIDTPFQIFGFKNPFSQDKETIYRSMDSATLRTILKNSMKETK